MKIFVTGSNGFLGSNFVSRYKSKYDFVGYDIKEGEDILDFQKLKNKMQGAAQVVHLAAIPKPVEGKTFEEYFRNNVQGTFNVVKAAYELKIKRVVYASSTTIYGIERGIPFKTPIKEDQQFVSQYLKASDLSTRECDLSYHMSKVMAEQILAWYGLNKKLQTVALRFGPIDKVFLKTSVSVNNATQAIDLCIKSTKEYWYEAFSIVDEIPQIDISKAKHILEYKPEKPHYSNDQIHD